MKNFLNAFQKSVAVSFSGLAALALAALPSQATNTATSVNTSATDLTAAGSYSTTSVAPTAMTTYDVEFLNSTYGSTTFTDNSATALSYGTLNDLDTTQSLIITDNGTAGSITLATPANGVAPSSTDLLYVAAGGNLTIQNGSAALGLNFFSSSGNFDVGTGGTLNISSIIGIATGGNQRVALTKTGNGTLILSGANSFGFFTNNEFTLNAGTVIVNNSLALGQTSGNIVINAGTIESTNNTTLSTYAGGFTLAGDFTLAGANWSLGAGPITLSSNRIITVASTGTTGATLGGTIQGAYSLTFTGTNTAGTPGVVTLSGANTFSGGLNINGSYNNIILGSTSALGATTNVLAFGASSNATVSLNGFSNTIGGLSGDSTSTIQNNSSTATATLTVSSSGSNSYSGLLKDGGSKSLGLTVAGGGTLTLTNSELYTGTTTLGNTSATIGNTTGITGLNVQGSLNGTTGTALTLSSGSFNDSSNTAQGMGTLTVTGGDNTVTSTNTSGTSGLTFSSVVGYTNAGTVNYVVSGGTNGTTNQIVLTGQTANSFINAASYFNGSNYAFINATGGYVRGINYGVDANSQNDTSGATFTSANYVDVSGTSVTGQGTASIKTLEIADTSTVTLAGTLTTLTLSSGGILKSGGSASSINNGNITTGGATTLYVRTDQSTDSLTINSNITSTTTGGLVKVGAGTLILGGTNAYTGTTYIYGGTLQLSNGATLGGTATNGNTLIVSGGATLDLNGSSVTVGAGNGTALVAAGSFINNSSSTASTLTIEPISFAIEAGTLENTGSGGLNVSYQGNGSSYVTITSATNSYSGTTTIGSSSGNTSAVRNSTASAFGTSTLILYNGAQIYASTATSLGFTNNMQWYSSSGSSIAITGGGTLSGNITLENANPTLTTSGTTTLSGVIGDGGSGYGFTYGGGGTLVLAGANTYTGTTAITGGTLTVGNGTTGSINSSSAITVAAGSTLGFNEANLATIANGITVTGTGIVTGSEASGQINTISSVITGTGNVSQTGAGTTILSGADNYSGTTIANVSGGTLQIGNGTSGSISTSSTVSTILGSTLAFDEATGSSISNNISDVGIVAGAEGSGITNTLSGITSGAGAFTQSGLGTTTLTGADTYTGATTVNGGGTLNIGNGSTGSLGTTPSSFAGAFTFAVAGGTANFNENSTGFTQSIGALTFTGGEDTLQTTGTSGTETLTVASPGGTRSVGAAVNYVNSGASSANTIVLTGRSGFIDQGTFYGGGNYAWAGTGAAVRGIAYGSDAGAVTDSTGASAASTAYLQITTASISGQAGNTFTTIDDVGSNNLALATAATLTTKGFLLTGGSTATISGGTGITPGSGNELVLRTNTSGDQLTISSNLIASGTNALTKSGAGTVILTGTDGFTGATYVDNGTLELGSGGTATSAGALTVNTGGTFLFAGANNSTNVYKSGSAVTLNSGTVAFASTISGASQTFGALTLTGSSTVDFGSGSTTGNTLRFASLATLPNGFNLKVTDWTGTAGAADNGTTASQDRLLFTANPNLTASQLSEISFYNDSGTFIGTGQEISFTGTGGGYEIIAAAVPEPSTIFAGLFLLGLLGWSNRRQLRDLLVNLPIRA